MSDETRNEELHELDKVLDGLGADVDEPEVSRETDEAPEAGDKITADPSAKVIRDLTARVQTPNALYPKARIQVRSDGIGALFVPNQPHKPLLLFRAEVPVPSRGGVGTTDDGGKVVFTHRALGCGWPLCKSRVPTATLSTRW